MPIDYDHVMSLKSEGEEVTYTDRDTMLYALGVGMGRDPMNKDELPFVYENGLKTIPTMATVITFGAQGFMAHTGINFMLMVHGEQRLQVHKELPAAATVTIDGRITGAYDKGEGKGALLTSEMVVHDKASGDKLCTLGSTLFCRGDGGFGGPSEGAPKPHALPEREPDQTIETATRPDQALLYRLSGDRNPLHSDPEFAKMAGFDRPILHGLCSYGTACRGVLSEALNYDNAKIKSFDARFSSPVFPGETILTDVWRDDHIISFRSRLKERDVVCLNNGKCEIA